MSWPPLLADLKGDLGIDDTRDDTVLQTELDAAVDYVQRFRPDLFVDDAGDPIAVPVVGADVQLGTLRLAGRWHTRRRSPDGLVNMNELGSVRIPRVDPDIDQLLGIGPVIA